MKTKATRCGAAKFKYTVRKHIEEELKGIVTSVKEKDKEFPNFVLDVM